MAIAVCLRILAGLFYLLICAKGEEEVDGGTSEVIALQESYIPNTGSYAMWEGQVSQKLASFTLCYRVKIYYYRPEVTVFSYINTNKEKIRTDHNRRGLQMLAAGHGFRVDTGIVTPLMHWSAFCFSLDTASSSFVMYFNGEKWQGETVGEIDADEAVEALDGDDDPDGSSTFTPRNDVLMDSDGTIVLGQDQDAPAGVFDATQSFSGEITDLNLWSRPLTSEEMSDITSCRSRPSGDVLDWDASTWIIGADSSKKEVQLNETCRVFPSPFFMFPDKLKFSDASSLCQAFGGEVTTPRNPTEQEMVHSLAEENSHICGRDGGALMWLGITDEHEEGDWRFHKSQENVSYVNWSEGQPNGKTIENCAVLKGTTFKGGWTDQTCRKSFKVCVMCTLEIPVFIRFRGICDSNLYDDRYILAGMKNNKPYFRGYYRSQLYYTADNRWRLENIMENNTYAIMEDDGSLDFPIGRHMWKFSHGFCGEKKGSPQSLAFTNCAKNKEFTCDDGTCTPINQVCDRRVQCPDLSDELDCSTVLPPKGYQTTLPPPSPDFVEPLPVYLNLTLNDFSSIDAVRNRFTVELVVRMIWKDLRLQFKHLRRDRQLNIILPSEAENIWVPTVDFLNAENNQHTVVDADCKITIKRLGDPLSDQIEHSKEARIYRGEDNYIRINRKYTIPFRCNFNFFYFPFNTDYCTMIFRINKNTENLVVLEKYGAGIRYEGPIKLVEYEIGGMYMERLDSDEPYSGLTTVIQMKHLFVSQLVTIFVPTTLINFISFATFFFKWFDFQNRIMVSLTALLVLSTLFAQISDSLPKTSYFKLIDIWFFISIVFAFLTIMTHTMVEYHHHYSSPTQSEDTSVSFTSVVSVKPAGGKDDDKPKIKNRTRSHRRPILIDRVANTLIWCLYLIFFLIFWAVSFSQKIAEDGKELTSEDREVTGYPE